MPTGAARTTTGRLLPQVPTLLPALLPVALVLASLHLPLMEDSLFWWVPKALYLLERGPAWVAAGDLPSLCLPDLPLPHQWRGGIPDYGHPPTWFYYLAIWIRILGASATTIRLACLPWALLMGLGIVVLSRRLCPSHPTLAALPALTSPPILMQAASPDTDLPLLAMVPWCIIAISHRRPWSYALIAASATWMKEPGILLAIPPLLVISKDRRFLISSLSPAIALGAWYLIHLSATGWGLAGAERIPEDLQHYIQDMLEVLQLVFLEQGRWMPSFTALAALLSWYAYKGNRDRFPFHDLPTWQAAFALLFVNLALFSTLNFLGGRETRQSYTHVRYLLPAMLLALTTSSAVVAGVLPRIKLPIRLPVWTPHLLIGIALTLSTSHLLEAHRRGPEASLYGLDLARAWTIAVNEIPSRASAADTWVGSYLYTAITRPYAGLVEEPLRNVLPFGPETLPEDIQPGALLIRSSYGEPLGRLGELQTREILRVGAGDAWISFSRVLPGRTASPPASRDGAPQEPGPPFSNEN